MSTISQHNWRYDEVQELLSIRAEDDIVSRVSGTVRDAVVYEQITSRLRDRGIYRTKAQVTNKLKALKKQFLQIANNGQNGDEAKGWPFFSLCDTVWGSGQWTTAVAGSKKPTTTSRCPETQPVYETDVSVDESDSSTENLDLMDGGISDRRPSTPERSLHRASDAAPLLHSHDKASTSTEDLWSYQEMQVMLDLIKRHQSETSKRSDRKKNWEIFKMLSDGMAERGFRRSEGQIRSKWSYLKQCYKAAVSNQTDDSGPGQCVFFEVLKELLGDMTMASSNRGQEGIDTGFEVDASPQHSPFKLKRSDSCSSVDARDSFYRPSAAGPLNRCDVTSQRSPQETPSRKRKQLSNGVSSTRHFLEQLQSRQNAWLAAQMRPFQQHEDRMLSLLESLAQTSERMVTMMTDCLQNIGQQHSQHSTIPGHHQNTSHLSSALSEESFQDEDSFGLV